MALIVQKYGGTSVADADRMRAVAENVAFTRRQGHDVVVVVSAMGKETDNLIALANAVSTTQPGREMDMLLTIGERKSMALLCMALADLGVEAVSFTGSQVGIITDNVHGKAKILEVKGDRVRAALAEGKVCVVAGFQGISLDKEITTLGRGGSDTTAVALAAAFGADSCEIYTDVTGVFSADPRIVPSARRLARVSFEEMLEMAATGGRVLALRSVEFARNHRVPLHVRSSFTWEPGTWVTEEDTSMEEPIISGVTHDVAEAKVTVRNVPDRPGIAARLFRALADANVNVDMIVQNTSVRRLHRHLLHRAQGRHGRGREDRGRRGRRDRRRRGHPRRDHRQGERRRLGDAHQPGHRGQGVRDPGDQRRQHRDDLDVDHPDHLRRGPCRHGAGRPVAPHGVRSRLGRELRRPPPRAKVGRRRAPPSRDAGNSRSGRAVPEPMPGATEVSMTVVALVRAGGWVDRNEVALARAYGATKAVYAVCRMVQDGEAVDPVTARAFRRRAERTGAGLLSLGGEGSSVGTQTVHALLGTWAGGLARAGSYLEAYLLAGVAPDAPADVFDSLLHVGMMFEADLGGHPACESAVSAAFASAAHPAAS